YSLHANVSPSHIGEHESPYHQRMENVESILRDESNDSDVTLEEYLDATISEEELKCSAIGSDHSNIGEFIEKSADLEKCSTQQQLENQCSPEEEKFLRKIISTFQPSHLRIHKLTWIEPPWTHLDEKEEFSQSDYELFCDALQRFNEIAVEGNGDEWLETMKRLLPTLRSSIRNYSDKHPTEYDEGRLEERLVSWVEFWLSKLAPFQGDIVNEIYIRVGCRIAQRLFLMPSQRFTLALNRRHIMHRLLDLVESRRMCNTTRCEAARTLFTSLFHCEASADAVFEGVVGDSEGVTPYVRIIKLLLHANEMPIHVVLQLRSVVNYCAFLYWLMSIRKSANAEASREKGDDESIALLTSLKKMADFVTVWRKRKNEDRRFLYKSLHESGILQSLCSLATLTKVSNRVRIAAVQLLRVLVDFHGGDIAGTVLLAHSTTEIVSLVIKILTRSEKVMKQRNSSTERSLLPYALHTLQLIDTLAIANQSDDDMDCEQRISALRAMLMLSVTTEGVKSLVAALAYPSCMKHLLEVFTLGNAAIGDEHMSGEMKTRMRHSASYGYACEILFTLARFQSDGCFWRKHGAVLCHLIDGSFISAATSLKQWTDPLRYALAHAANASSLHFLLQRLESYSDKFENGEPPFAAITVLRLLNALLDEHHSVSNMSRNERYNEIISMFYEEDGLEQVVRLLKLANMKRSPGSAGSRSTLSGDSSIYVALVYPALCLIGKVHKSLASINKLLDVSAIDVLLDTYAVCGFGRTCEHIRIRRLILEALNAHVSLQSSSSKSSLHVMLEKLLTYGLSQPRTFLAVVDIVRRLLPRPVLASVVDRLCEADRQILLSSCGTWMDHLLMFKQHLSFIVLLGITTSRVLRSHVIALCVRLAHLGVNAAKFIAGELLEQALRALAVSSQNAVLNALNDESDDEGDIVSEEVRFGAATDYTTAAMIALTASCVRDTTICIAFADLLASRRLFLSTALKFFNVASHKTVSHVVFQKHLIRMFVELCQMSDTEQGEVPILLSELHFMVCSALCEHVGQNEQSLDTVIPALKALITIGDASKHTRASVQKAFNSRPGVLTRFIRRLEATSDYSSSALNIASGLLLTLIENFFAKSASLCVVLQWPLSVDESSGGDCVEHPLLRLTAFLRESTDFEWSSAIVPRLENILRMLEHSCGSNALGNACMEDDLWPNLENGFHQIARSLTVLNAFSRCAISDELDGLDSHMDFDPPMMAVDVKQIADEFFPMGIVDKRSFDASSPATEDLIRPLRITLTHNKGSLLWKDRTAQRRKRAVAHSSSRSLQEDPTQGKRRK
uniref:Uncharacterized protein n=3 Tax=Parascaris univalens TaxID=6257 RepID=A0A915BQK9_PARUN